MKCTRCHAVNEVSASRCKKCGAPLQFYERSDRSGGKLIFMVFAVLLAGAVLFNYIARDPVPPSDKTTEEMSVVDTKKNEKRVKGKRIRRVRIALFSLQGRNRIRRLSP